MATRTPETLVERLSKSLEETPGRALNTIIHAKFFGFTVGTSSFFLQPTGGLTHGYGGVALQALNAHYGQSCEIIMESFFGQGDITTAAELAACQAATTNGYSNNFSFTDTTPYPNLIFTPYKLILGTTNQWTIQRGKGCLIQVGRTDNQYIYQDPPGSGLFTFNPGTALLPFYDLPKRAPQTVNGFVVNPQWQTTTDGDFPNTGTTPIADSLPGFGTTFDVPGVGYQAPAIDLHLPIGYGVTYPNVGPINNADFGFQLFNPATTTYTAGSRTIKLWTIIPGGTFFGGPEGGGGGLRTEVPVLFLGTPYQLDNLGHGASKIPNVANPTDPEVAQYNPAKYGLFTIA